MLPTFVIGLREGVEASLIVGIVAAFLRQQGRRDALRAVWAGVLLALALCIGVAIGLQILDQALPQQQQEGLETVVATDRGRHGHVHDHLDETARARLR